MQKAKELGTKIILEDEFLAMLKESEGASENKSQDKIVENSLDGVSASSERINPSSEKQQMFFDF